MSKFTHEEHRTAIRSAIALGLDVEGEDPNMRDVVPFLSGDQIDWLAHWLASESIGRLK